jgi:hypothetical protein
MAGPGRGRDGVSAADPNGAESLRDWSGLTSLHICPDAPITMRLPELVPGGTDDFRL